MPEIKQVTGRISQPLLTSYFVASVSHGGEGGTGDFNLSVIRYGIREAREALLEYLGKLGGWQVAKWVVVPSLVEAVSAVVPEEVIDILDTIRGD